PGDEVCIRSRTRADGTVADLAIGYAAAVSVPVYETSSPDQTAWILGDSGAKAVIVETAKHARTVEKARPDLPELAHVWQIEAGGIVEIGAAGEGISDDEVRDRRGALRLGELAT